MENYDGITKEELINRIHELEEELEEVRGSLMHELEEQEAYREYISENYRRVSVREQIGE